MDRREALKKMAVGGVTVAGASVVMTSPAFAFTSPTPPLQPLITPTGNGTNVLTITLAPGLGSCPGSATSSMVDGTARSNFAAGTNITANTFSGPSATSFTVTRGNGSASSFTFRYRARYVCNYPGGSQFACRNWTVTVAGTSGNNWGTVTVTPVILDATCP